MSGVRFFDCKVVNSSRGCAVYARDGGRISDVTFENLELDLREFNGEDKSGEPVRLEITPRKGLGSIDGVTFKNIACRTPYVSVLQGNAKANIRNVSFKNLKLELLDRTARTKRLALFGLSNCANISFENVTVIRSAIDPDLWGGFTWEENCAGITRRGLVDDTQPRR